MNSEARSWGDRLFRGISEFSAFLIILVFVGMFFGLTIASWPAIKRFGLNFFLGAEWNPVQERFGALIPLVGTLLTTAIALIVAVPLSLGIAMFLTEIAPGWLRLPLGTAIELLAAIPSIVYGMWGLFVFAPLVAEYLEPPLAKYLGWLPLFSGPPLGVGILPAGLVLALMILPFISSVIRDVFQLVPQRLKEAAYGMGSTTWEVIRYILIPYGRKGIVGGILLGLGRALGETMAVTFVIGNTYHLSWSLLAPGNSIASTLANEFTEADSDLYLASLIELGLVLFLLATIILGLAQWWLKRSMKREEVP